MQKLLRKAPEEFDSVVLFFHYMYRPCKLNKMSMSFVYPRITIELRACYKVYVGKQIALTFYFLPGL